MITQKTFVCPIMETPTAMGEIDRRPAVDNLPFIKSWWMHELTSDFCIVTVVAEETDLDNAKISKSIPSIVHVATKKVFEETKWAEALTKFPNLNKILEIHQKCTVTLGDKTGMEE